MVAFTELFFQVLYIMLVMENNISRQKTKRLFFMSPYSYESPWAVLLTDFDEYIYLIV